MCFINLHALLVREIDLQLLSWSVAVFHEVDGIGDFPITWKSEIRRVALNIADTLLKTLCSPVRVNSEVFLRNASDPGGLPLLGQLSSLLTWSADIVNSWDYITYILLSALN